MYANWWSCCRNNSNNAWYSNGNNGIFNNNNFSNSYGVVPVLQLIRLYMELNELAKAYRLAEKNKKKNPIRVGFELHKYRDLLVLKENIENQTLEPSAFAYVVYRPVVREVFSAPMEMCIIDHYLDERIRPNMEQWINPCVYNNRRGRGLESALDKVLNDIAEISEGYKRDCWCIVCDITGYFPNANIDHAYRTLEYLLLKDTTEDTSELVYLLQRALYANHERIERKSYRSCWWDVKPEKSIFSKPFGTGAMPGKLIMQVAMTCYHDSVVKWLHEQGVCVTVYGDDMLFIVRDKERFLRYIMPEYRKRMADIGCTLHPHKFYCQHYTKGIKFCSQVVKIERKYAGKRTVYNFRKKVRRMRGKASVGRLNHFLSSFNSYLGFCKHRNAYGIIRDIVESLDDGWRSLTEYDDETRTLRAIPELNYRNLLTRKYNIKICKQYDKTRNRRSQAGARRAAAATRSSNE